MIKTVKHYLLMHFDQKYMSEPEYYYGHLNMAEGGHSFSDDYAVVKEVDFDLVIPDEFDPRNQMIAALERQRQKAMADYELLMNTLDGKIQSLRCIEHKPE